MCPLPLRPTVNEPSLRSLETAHFLDELEARIVQRLHVEATSDSSRTELLRSTGITDEKLLDDLSRMGITADELIALRFLPLIMVAWAEDHADLDERDVVKAQAKELGIREDSTAWLMLDTWLRKRPPGVGVDAWRRYTHEIFSKISPVASQRLIALTEKQMTAVAKASGGHLGFGKVSQKERVMIDRLVETMRSSMPSK